jgi:predicted phage terminase large subunit-like protein
MIDDLILRKKELLNNFLYFTSVFFELKNNSKFIIETPEARESHIKIISREFMEVFTGNCNKLIVNIPRRHGKTDMACYFVAWSIAHYPDSNFLYVSNSQQLAGIATAQIRDIISMPIFRKLFGVEIRQDSDSKNYFTTVQGGTIQAVGAGGTLQGKEAGIKYCMDRFNGCIIADDIITDQMAFSEIEREGRNKWHYGTLIGCRNNGEKTPVVYICQRLHEHDIVGYLKEKEPNDWKVVKIPGLDSQNNALCPAIMSTKEMLFIKETASYMFWSQIQQEPVPDGGSLFRPEDFKIFEKPPRILLYFVTCDTAETANPKNDATVFSLWGLYEIEQFGVKSGMYGLHWIDCYEIRVEPKFLRDEFMAFYSKCYNFHSAKVSFCIIEEKTTGVTLVSVLKEIQGLNIIPIKPTQNKMVRFQNIQHYIGQKLISFTFGANHIKQCIEHMAKITANGAHLHDDIADTCEQAVRFALMNKMAQNFIKNDTVMIDVERDVRRSHEDIDNVYKKAWGY